MADFDPLNIKNQLCFPIYACAREIQKAYTPFLEELDITYTQYITMMVMWEHKNISVKELGKILYLDSGTITPVIKNLEKKGLVTKNRDPQDERVVIISITDEGQAMRNKAIKIPQQIACAYKLNQEDAKQLYILINKLLGVISEEQN